MILGCYKNAMPPNVKFSIRTSQMDTLEEATKATKMEEIMIETSVDPDIILGKVQRQLGSLNIDDQGASSLRKDEEQKSRPITQEASPSRKFEKPYVFPTCWNFRTLAI
jgi:hypothetical protein